MLVIAHIGPIPVQEYAPFVVPVIALYLYGRAWSRRHRKKIAHLPGPGEQLDERTVQIVLDRWAAAGHGDVDREQVALMYPPGPDGATASELAQRVASDPVSVSRRLDDLAELGYVEYDSDDAERRPWLTVEGIDLLNVTEDALLAAFADAPGASHEPASPTPPAPRL